MSDTDREQIAGSVDILLRDRIIAAILSEDDIYRCADAVIAALTRYYHVTERVVPLDTEWENDD